MITESVQLSLWRSRNQLHTDDQATVPSAINVKSEDRSRRHSGATNRRLIVSPQAIKGGQFCNRKIPTFSSNKAESLRRTVDEKRQKIVGALSPNRILAARWVWRGSRFIAVTMSKNCIGQPAPQNWAAWVQCTVLAECCPVDAEKWWLKAADQGNSDSMCSLAFMYKRSDRLAEYRCWIDRAAHAQHPFAMFALGINNENSGYLGAARKWLQLSGKAGYNLAARHLMRIANAQGDTAYVQQISEALSKSDTTT